MSAGYVLEQGVYGPRLVVTGPWSEGIRAYMESHRIDDLYLNYARGWKGSSLEFLAQVPWLKAFTILDWAIRDVSPVHHLRDLRMLEISTYCDTEIDFEIFPHMEDCKLTWRRGATSLFNSRTVRRLFLSDYVIETSDLFGQLTQLESLSVAGGALRSLEGLRPLHHLHFLGLYNLKKLKSLRGLEALATLGSLEINECPGISHINELAQLKNLRRLEINEDGEIESLRPIAALAKIREVYFYGSTRIRDGDLSTLRTLPQLAKVSFQDRPHYNLRRDDFVVGAA